MADQLLVPRELLERLDFGKDTARALQALPELRDLLAQPASEPKPVDDEEAFEQWHNSFYGHQDPYNPIRSLEKHSELGYSDGVVTAQFVAFKGGRGNPAPAGVVKLPERVLLRDSTGVSWATKDGWNACLDEVARLNGVKP